MANRYEYILQYSNDIDCRGDVFKQHGHNVTVNVTTGWEKKNPESSCAIKNFSQGTNKAQRDSFVRAIASFEIYAMFYNMLN